ncbi:Uncharacterised protein [Serratia fonticola]|nr:Uncharacterised protein [Serratia fonticola]
MFRSALKILTLLNKFVARCLRCFWTSTLILMSPAFFLIPIRGLDKG